MGVVFFFINDLIFLFFSQPWEELQMGLGVCGIVVVL
jgi:hypothetical protein